jgi:hypothetical protein
MPITHRLTTFVTGAFALLLAAATPQLAQAARPCVENFTEANEGNGGKTFKDFVDVKGTTAEKVYVVLGRELAKAGYSGIEINKDIGLLSGYIEARGLRITTQITATETEPGTLRVEVVQRVPKGIRAATAAARDGMCESLDLIMPKGERTDPATDASISLKREGGNTPLKSVVGQFRKAGVDPFIQLYYDFAGARSDIRVAEKRPVLLVRGKTDPAKMYVLVKCDANKGDDKRSVKIGSAGKLLKAGFTGVGELAPDEDWTVPVTSSEESPGLWRVAPSADLKRGEYGLWDVKGYGMAFFGVD